jgi:lysophospholipase L1-like esterase
MWPVKKIIIGCAKAVLAIVISSIPIEIALNIFHDQLGIKNYSDLRGVPYPAMLSNYLPFTTSPGMEVRDESGKLLFQFNELGYIGETPKRIEKPTKSRVLLLGDSFTLGWSVDYRDSFGSLLTARFLPEVEVINAAYRAGYSIDAYYAWLQREGQALKPDAVVIVLNFADVNDLYTTVWEKVDQFGGPIKVSTTRRYTGPDRNVFTGLPWYYRMPGLRQSYLFVMVAERMSLLSEKIANRLFGKRPPIDSTPEQAVEKFRTTLRALKGWASRANVDLLFYLIPPPAIAPNEWHSGPPTSELLAESGVKYVELAYTMDDIIGPQDYHFSLKGHRLVTAMLTKSICELLERDGFRLNRLRIPKSDRF